MQLQEPRIISNSNVATANNNAKLKASETPSTAEIQAWIVSYLAQLLDIDPDEIDVNIPFDQYGLDSSAAIGLTGDLEDWLGHQIDPTVLYDYPTIKGLVEHLSTELLAA